MNECMSLNVNNAVITKSLLSSVQVQIEHSLSLYMGPNLQNIVRQKIVMLRNFVISLS